MEQENLEMLKRFVVLLVAGFLVSCNGGDSGDDPGNNEGRQLGEGEQPTQEELTAAAACRDGIPGQVERVLSGDTIAVEMAGTIEDVVYLGVDSPDTNDACSAAALEHNRHLVEGQQVMVKREITDRDSLGRLVRHVCVGSLHVNLEMVRAGYAAAAPQEPDVQYVGSFDSMEVQATVQNRGCWGAFYEDELGQSPLPDHPDWELPPPPPIPGSPGNPGNPGNPAPPGSACCRVCTTGKACGDSCISDSYICRQPPGCACDG